MRNPWGSWACTVIGLSAVTAPNAMASDFNATIVPAKAPVAPGTGITRRPETKPAAGHPAFTILAMPDALEPSVGAGKQAPSYDLRVAVAYQGNRLTPIKQSLRVRGTGMKDAYLHGTSGLRMSVGSSYHMQYRASDYGPGAAAGSKALMRLPVGAVNLRDGYESYAPVAMAGYDTYVSDRMKVGVEGGMMVGRSTAMYADETIPRGSDESHAGHNPVADLVMSYAF